MAASRADLVSDEQRMGALEVLPLALKDGLEKRGVLSIGYPQCCGERLPRFSRGTYKIIKKGNPSLIPKYFF
jgi:hypothetical protein